MNNTPHEILYTRNQTEKEMKRFSSVGKSRALCVCVCVRVLLTLAF